MRTSINGKRKEWPQEVKDMWRQAQETMDADVRELPISAANYFTPRPYVDQYNRGDPRHGFTYTVQERKVYQVTWRVTDE